MQLMLLIEVITNNYRVWAIVFGIGLMFVGAVTFVRDGQTEST